MKLPIPPLRLTEAQVLAMISLGDDTWSMVLTQTTERLHDKGYIAQSLPEDRLTWVVTPEGTEALKQMFEWAMLHRLVLTT